MLRPQWLAPDAANVFVFDDDWIRSDRLALKRVVFMYECLLELPGIEIRRGHVCDELEAAATDLSVRSISTARTPAPRLKRQMNLLRERGLQVEVLEDPPFVNPPAGLDLKRFSRYWRKVQKQALTPTRT